MRMLNWHLGDAIGKLREMQGMTRARLASIVGISAYSMGQIERTGKCRTRTLEEIAKALNVSVGRLYEEIPKDLMSSTCASQDPAHQKYHDILESVLHSNDEKCIRAVTTMLEAIEEKTTPPRGQPAPVPAHPGSKAEASSAGGGLKPEHGPFKVTDPVRPGDRIRIYDDTKEEPPQEVPHKRKAK